MPVTWLLLDLRVRVVYLHSALVALHSNANRRFLGQLSQGCHVLTKDPPASDWLVSLRTESVSESTLT